MAANMYRVGGMYVNVDLFIKQKPFQFCILRRLCGAILVRLHLILRYGSVTFIDAPSWCLKVRIYKYLGFKMGQASRLSWLK